MRAQKKAGWQAGGREGGERGVSVKLKSMPWTLVQICKYSQAAAAAAAHQRSSPSKFASFSWTGCKTMLQVGGGDRMQLEAAEGSRKPGGSKLIASLSHCK